MVKYEIEGFTGGQSMGTRPMKFYVSSTKKDEIEKFIDAFPKRGYQDTRTHKNRQRPEEKLQRHNPADMLLNLDDIWDTEKLKELSKKQDEEESKDIWTS